MHQKSHLGGEIFSGKKENNILNCRSPKRGPLPNLFETSKTDVASAGITGSTHRRSQNKQRQKTFLHAEFGFFNVLVVKCVIKNHKSR